MPLYLVSGEGEIAPALLALQSRKRRVYFDGAVRNEARLTLRHTKRFGGRFVVVAHGRPNGTVRWYKTARAASEDWLWVGMPSPPTGVRIYLYCCYVGRHLPAYLAACEVFGHVGPVPIPSGPDDSLVLDFLDQVDRLVRTRRFDRISWRRRLVEYLEGAFTDEVETPTSLLGAATLRLIIKSLGDE
jgi:hypothetical protein